MIDALGSVGVRGVDMPFTPMKVWDALRPSLCPHRKSMHEHPF